MMHRVGYLAAATAVASLALIAACGDDDEEPTAPPDIVRTTYTATLSGAAERPNPVTTNATGSSTLTLFDDDSIQFVVRVASIDSVTTSHIHAGDAATAGPILFGFPEVNPSRSFSADTALHTGTITPTSAFTAPFTWDSLLTRLNAGTAYVNVHTKKNSGGEIRGQLARQP
jgi:hypothetical protein